MLAALKEALHGVVPMLLYLAIFVVIAAAAFRKAQWGILLLIAIVAQPNIWYKIHPFPLGTETMDLLLVAILVGISVNGGGFQRPPRWLLIGAYAVMSYVALWHASIRFDLPAPISTANHLLLDLKNYIEMLLLYFVAYNVLKTEEDQKRAIVLMTFVVLLVAVREIRNFDAGMSFSYDRRMAGPFWVVGLGANHFGAFIAYVGAFIAGLYLCDRQRRRRWLYLGTLLCLVSPLFFTYSRGAYAAALLALVIFGVVRKHMILVGVAALAVTWQTVLPPTVVERITMTETPEGQIEESAALRLLVWERAKQLFVENPVFGIGYEGFSVSERVGRLTNVHNYYMQTAAEEGVIGLVFLALIIMHAGITGWRLYRIGLSDFHKGVGLGFVGAVAAMMVSNVFGDRWSYFALGAYFWILWGIADRALQSALAARAQVGARSAASLAPTVQRRVAA